MMVVMDRSLPENNLRGIPSQILMRHMQLANILCELVTVYLASSVAFKNGHCMGTKSSILQDRPFFVSDS